MYCVFSTQRDKNKGLLLSGCKLVLLLNEIIDYRNKWFFGQTFNKLLSQQGF